MGEAEKTSSGDEKAKVPEAKDSGTPKKRTIWVYTTIVFAITSAFLLFANMQGTGMLVSLADTDNAQDVTNYTLDYINQYLLAEGMTAKLVNVTNDRGLYRLYLDISGMIYESYVTKDGALLFTRAPVDITKPPAMPEQPQEQQQEQPAEVPKSDRPKVNLYVMSFCPFGNKAEDTMYPVYTLLKDKVDWSVHYIVSVSGDTIRSLHGQPETDQNIREVCVKRDYGLDAFWKFVTYVNRNCGSNGSCWQDAAKEAGADTEKIEACFEKDGLSLMKAEAAATEAAGAGGSPTLIINGAMTRSVYTYGQPNVYKEAICSAFNTPPQECSTVLESIAGSTTASGSCG